MTKQEPKAATVTHSVVVTQADKYFAIPGNYTGATHDGFRAIRCGAPHRSGAAASKAAQICREGGE